MGRVFAWFDMGTHDSLLEAASFVQTLERRQGPRIACPEEVAYQQGFIINDEFVAFAKKLGNSAYGEYLLNPTPNAFGVALRAETGAPKAFRAPLRGSTPLLCQGTNLFLGTVETRPRPTRQIPKVARQLRNLG
jgi:hypothetical protein